MHGRRSLGHMKYSPGTPSRHTVSPIASVNAWKSPLYLRLESLPPPSMLNPQDLSRATEFVAQSVRSGNLRRFVSRWMLRIVLRLHWPW